MKRAVIVKEEQPPPEPEVTDEGVLKLMADILHARVKVVNLCMARLAYNTKRLQQFEDRLDEINRDKTYLEVSDRIRPSEAKVELRKQKQLREDRIKFLTQAIVDEKKIVKESEETMKVEQDVVFKLTGEMVGDAQGGGDEDWEQYYDEQYGQWAWYNKVTGEISW